MMFAKLDNSSVVVQVIVAEQDYINAQTDIYVQTDPDGVSPKNYAGIGDTWHPELNAFVRKSPFVSWVLNTDSCEFEAPTPMLQDGKSYKWDESTLSWKERIKK